MKLPTRARQGWAHHLTLALLEAVLLLLGCAPLLALQTWLMGQPGI